jgi:hypothetical protein
VELSFLHKKKRKALLYFVSTKSNLFLTAIDLLTKKTLLVYSVGQACIEEKLKNVPEVPAFDFFDKKKVEEKKINKDPKKEKSESSESNSDSEEEEEDEKEEDTSLGRVYRQGLQAARLFGSELSIRFETILSEFKSKYGVFLSYNFIIYFKGAARYRKIILREILKKKKFKVLLLGDITQLPHNGCRARKAKRTRLKKKPRRSKNR